MDEKKYSIQNCNEFCINGETVGYSEWSISMNTLNDYSLLNGYEYILENEETFNVLGYMLCFVPYNERRSTTRYNISGTFYDYLTNHKTEFTIENIIEKRVFLIKLCKLLAIDVNEINIEKVNMDQIMMLIKALIEY